jgi:hypothetical protein
MLNLLNNPAELARLQTLLLGMGAVGAPRADANGATRTDAAGDTLFLARELEFVSAQSYDVLNDPIVGRTLLPMNWSVPEGSEVYSYDMYDGYARAEWITNWASIVGQADVFKTRFQKSARSFQSSYSYSHEDLAKAAFARQPVDRMRANMARMAHEFFLDDLIADGDAVRGINGLTNSTNFPEVSLPNGDWDDTTTSEDIFEDLDAIGQAAEQQSRGVWISDTLVLPLNVKPFVTRVFSTFLPKPAIDVWLESKQSNIKQVTYWARLNTVASDSDHRRALCYKKDPRVLEFMGSYDFREMPAQAVGLTFQIPTLGRVIGLVERYPLATNFADLGAVPT